MRVNSFKSFDRFFCLAHFNVIAMSASEMVLAIAEYMKLCHSPRTTAMESVPRIIVLMVTYYEILDS